MQSIFITLLSRTFMYNKYTFYSIKKFNLIINKVYNVVENTITTKI